MAAAARHPAGIRLVWRHIQRQRAANPRPKSERRQSVDLANRQRHRERTARPGCGSCGTSRNFSRGSARHQDRPEESRSGVHGQPEALLFVNTMFGWPMVPSADMPGGGPAYPLSASGVRLPLSADGSGDVAVWRVQRHRRSATTTAIRRCETRQARAFRSMAACWSSAEMQYTYPALGTMLYADQPARCRDYTSSASGTTPKGSTILHWTAADCRWPTRRAAGSRGRITAISASMR